MKTRKFNFFYALLAMLFISATAVGQDTENVYADWDENSDGLLDENEFGTAFDDSGYYDTWDTNDDNYLDENEWDSGVNSNFTDYNEEDGGFTDWDADSDGQLNEDEFQDGLFDYYDEDDDNNLNEEEYNNLGW